MKLYARRDERGIDATVAYRNRVQEVKVPAVEQLPLWGAEDQWTPPALRTAGSADGRRFG